MRLLLLKNVKDNHTNVWLYFLNLASFTFIFDSPQKMLMLHSTSNNVLSMLTAPKTCSVVD